MQVINTKDHSRYFCPLKYTSNSGYTEKCQGPKCMWWSYSTTIDFTIFPQALTSIEDLTRGYCGK